MTESDCASNHNGEVNAVKMVGETCNGGTVTRGGSHQLAYEGVPNLLGFLRLS
jgi:hypothetical protein